MSVTVADIMKLPSMHQAKVIGGERGLSKVVYSISVLESADPGNLVDSVFQKGEFFGSEIVITGFINCPENVEIQCANIRRLAEGGEIGLILFYVGCIMKSVDPRVIALADELDFVLIQMPSTLERRYSEVISDVTAAIFHDRLQNESVFSDILANISHLPEHQRTMSTVLQMLSDRLRASLILSDSSFNILNLVTWPRSIEKELNIDRDRLRKYSWIEKGQNHDMGGDGLVYHLLIRPDNGAPMHLFIQKAGNPISIAEQEQVEDTVRICANIWGREHSSVVIRELIRAILQDDPLKMRRLSEAFHIDVLAIHDMWILDCGNKQRLRELAEQIDELNGILGQCTSLQFGDLYDGRVVLFSDEPSSEKEAMRTCDEILRQVADEPDASFVWFHGLKTTADARKDYQNYCAALESARKIYPRKKCFSMGDIAFALECAEIIKMGETRLQIFTEYTDRLEQCGGEWNAVDTLACHLLDNGASVTKTAETLFLHKNTVKYRIHVLTDALGFPPDRMPDAWPLYQALAIRRLLQ